MMKKWSGGMKGSKGDGCKKLGGTVANTQRRSTESLVRIFTLFKEILDRTHCPLCLPICLRIIGAAGKVLEFILLCKGLEFLYGILWAFSRGDSLWDAMPGKHALQVNDNLSCGQSSSLQVKGHLAS